MQSATKSHDMAILEAILENSVQLKVLSAAEDLYESINFESTYMPYYSQTHTKHNKTMCISNRIYNIIARRDLHNGQRCNVYHIIHVLMVLELIFIENVMHGILIFFYIAMTLL